MIFKHELTADNLYYEDIFRSIYVNQNKIKSNRKLPIKQWKTHHEVSYLLQIATRVPKEKINITNLLTTSKTLNAIKYKGLYMIHPEVVSRFVKKRVLAMLHKENKYIEEHIQSISKPSGA